MYRGGGIAPRGVCICTGAGAGVGLRVAVTIGVGAGVETGAGVGFCPNAEQTKIKPIMINCLAVLPDNLNKRIRIS